MKYPRAKTGLLFIIVGILASVVAVILSAFGLTFNNNSLYTAGNVITVIAGLVELVGLIVCGCSKAKHFKKALIVLIISVVISLVSAILIATVSMPAWIIILFIVLIGLLSLLVDINIIKGCGEVTEDPSVIGHAKLVLLFLGLRIVLELVSWILGLFVAGLPQVVLTILGVFVSLCGILYAVFYLILLFRAHHNVK